MGTEHMTPAVRGSSWENSASLSLSPAFFSVLPSCLWVDFIAPLSLSLSLWWSEHASQKSGRLEEVVDAQTHVCGISFLVEAIFKSAQRFKV